MREMLEPLFGSGAGAAQVVIALLFVIGLVVVAVWLVRRYAPGGHFGGAVRGRLPRLAVIDAMTVDARRKLVLVRRDNVEHLLLIGGPTDIVVEPGIVRTRTVSQRSATAARAAAAPPAAEATPAAEPARRPEPQGAEQPIPFPPRRVERPVAARHVRSVPQPVHAAEPDMPPAAPPPRRAVRGGPLEAPAAEDQRVTPFVPAAALAAESSSYAEAAYPRYTAAPEPEATAEIAAPIIDDVAMPLPPQELAPPSGEAEPDLVAEGPVEAPPLAAETAGGEGPSDEEAAARVLDLEKDMARLLGELSGRRGS